MSNALNTDSSDGHGKSQDQPRAILHKKILDAAESSPSESIEELSDQVSGASNELVEGVLEEYGDPAETPNESEFQTSSDEDLTESHDSADPKSGESESQDIETTPRRLTNKQRKTLEAILDNPDATQRELAQELDVTSATICNRVNSIPEFEWKFRVEHAEELLREEMDRTPSNTIQTAPAEEKKRSHEPASTDQSQQATLETTLVSKTIQACMNEETISAEEELQIISYFIKNT